MTEEIDQLSRRRYFTDKLATGVGIIAIVAWALTANRTALLLGSYSLLLGTSTGVVTYCLTRFTGILIEPDADSERSDESKEATSKSIGGSVAEIFSGKALETDADVEKDTGWLIGRLENVLVLSLVLASQYTALSIIFAAKSWVRVEDTATENTTYYLAGTLVNFTYSIAFGIGTEHLLDLL